MPAIITSIVAFLQEWGGLVASIPSLINTLVGFVNLIKSAFGIKTPQAVKMYATAMQQGVAGNFTNLKTIHDTVASNADLKSKP